MKMTHRLAGLVATLVFAASLAGAQSLGELAAKEKERRKAVKSTKAVKPAKVYTDSDLKKTGDSGTDTGGDGVAVDAAAGTTSADTQTSPPGDDREAAQATWREGMRTTKEQLTTLTTRDKELQALVSAQVQFGTADPDVTAQIQENTARLTEARAALDKLEREGRFRGYRE